jgi:hypothetical protein
MQTAMSCVKDVFPNSTVTPNGTNNYPIKVIVSAKVGNHSVEIWSGRQQDLFRKNATRRAQSMAEIKRNLLEYAENVHKN